jgi:hypothetical protein
MQTPQVATKSARIDLPFAVSLRTTSRWAVASYVNFSSATLRLPADKRLALFPKLLGATRALDPAKAFRVEFGDHRLRRLALPIGVIED